MKQELIGRRNVDNVRICCYLDEELSLPDNVVNLPSSAVRVCFSGTLVSASVFCINISLISFSVL
jgi:hypothetical protein